MGYPNRPGSMVPGISQDAAKAIISHAKIVRERVLALLRDRQPTSINADQNAVSLGDGILPVRPRVSEFSNLTEPTEEHGLNPRGGYRRPNMMSLAQDDALNERAQ